MASGILELPKIEDSRGNLSVIENGTIPFPVKRVYYLYGIPHGTTRGGHAHSKEMEFIIAVSGSFEVMINEGNGEVVHTLNKPEEGLLIDKNTWHELRNFSPNAVCLVLASHEYNENDYIHDYQEFIDFLKAQQSGI